MYDRQGSTYLFDLDYVEDVYTVDAAHQGNVSHFVNHSVSLTCPQFLWQQERTVGSAHFIRKVCVCFPLVVVSERSSEPSGVLSLISSQCDPNLQVFNVFVDNIDERLPRIALFSTRSIRAGEELTFDYKMQSK